MSESHSVWPPLPLSSVLLLLLPRLSKLSAEPARSSTWHASAAAAAVFAAAAGATGSLVRPTAACWADCALFRTATCGMLARACAGCTAVAALFAARLLLSEDTAACRSSARIPLAINAPSEGMLPGVH